MIGLVTLQQKLICLITPTWPQLLYEQVRHRVIIPFRFAHINKVYLSFMKLLSNHKLNKPHMGCSICTPTYVHMYVRSLGLGNIYKLNHKQSTKCATRICVIPKINTETLST